MRGQQIWQTVAGWPWGRWLMAVPLIATGALVRAVLLPGLGPRIPYLTFYPAVVVSALLGGIVAGGLATLETCIPLEGGAT